MRGGGICLFRDLNQNKIIDDNSEINQSALIPTNTDYWTDNGNFGTTSWAGNGTENNPYLIQSAGDLARLSYLCYTATWDTTYFKGKYFRQTCDIDLSAHYWQPIGIAINRAGSWRSYQFGGIYDGCGYTIDGIYTAPGSGDPASRKGLFGTLCAWEESTIIKNVIIGAKSYLKGSGIMGGIVGESWSIRNKIINCTNYATIESSDSSIGGIFGWGQITIENCVNYGDISGDSYIAGIVGYAGRDNYANIKYCTNYGNIQSTGSKTGGIVGLSKGNTTNYIEYCKNYGNVFSNSYCVGGILGYGENTTYVKFCENYAKVNASGSYIGGVCGRLDGCEIHNSFNSGKIVGGANEVGGIVGCFNANSIMRNCYNIGDVVSYYRSSEYASAGGLTGTNPNNGDIYTSYNAGNISNGSDFANAKVGGLSGDSYAGSRGGSFYNCFNVGTVSSAGSTYVGSLVGYASRGGTYKCYYLDTTYHKALGVTNDTFTGRSEVAISDLNNTAKDLSWYSTNSNWDATSYWDFVNDWMIIEGVNNGLPVLRSGMAIIDFDGKNLMPTENDVVIYGYNLQLSKCKYNTTLSGEPYLNFTITNSNYNLQHGFYILCPRLVDDVAYRWSVDMKLDNRESVGISPIGHEDDGRTGYIITDEWKTLTHTFIARTGGNHSFIFFCNSDKWYNGDIISIKNWSIQEVTATHLSDNAIGSKIFQTGCNISFSDRIPTRTGYRFMGWAKNSDGSELITDQNGILRNNTSYTDSKGVWVASGRITLYSTWEANEYCVSFNSNGGVGIMDEQEFNYGTAQNLSQNEFVKTGYTFVGWATSQTNANNGNATYTNRQSVTNLTTQNNKVVPLYAVWQANTYNVVFNANGGTGTISNQAFVYDVSQTLNENKYQKTNYTFVGWATSQTDANVGVVSYQDKESVKNLTASLSDTVNLYAVWKVNYEARYDKSGAYWYIEIGKAPQTRVDRSLNIKLNNLKTNNSSSLTLSENVYVVSRDISLLGYIYDGAEYCVYYNQWYLVEPIRWRLQGTYHDGDIVTGGVNAVLPKIIYLDSYSSGDTNYSATISQTFFTNLEVNQDIDSIIMKFTPSDLSGINGSVYIASEAEIQTVAESYDVVFSDLLCDIVGTRYYYTRTPANDGNMRVYSYLGFASAAYPTYQYGIQFIVKVADFVCVKNV